VTRTIELVGDKVGDRVGDKVRDKVRDLGYGDFTCYNQAPTGRRTCLDQTSY